MSTGSTTLPGSGSSGAAARRRRLPRLRDASIRSKLALVLVVPVAAVLALATVRLVDVGSRADETRRVEQFTELATDVSAVTQDIHLERMAAARYLATAPGTRQEQAARDAYAAQVARTDLLIDRYTGNRRAADDRTPAEANKRRDTGDDPSAVQQRLDRIDDHLRTMDATRKKVVDRDQIAVPEAVLRYGVVITDLVGYGDVLNQFAGDGEVADRLRAVSAFARAKAGTAEQEAVAFAARSAGTFSQEEYATFVATQTSQQEALLAFFLAADPAQRGLVNDTVAGDAVTLADRVTTELNRSVGVASRISAEDAAQAIGAVLELMRRAEVRLETRLVDDARDASAAVTRQALIESALVLLTLIVAVVLAVMLARSLNLSLRRLREGALSVANRDLPDAVARLRDVRNLGDGAADDIVRQVRDPIQLNDRDEIGQVAQAFNVVHREAVRIAAEQAALRTSVSSMFLNLARRSQSLVDRMIGELDQIERGEEDPKRLAQLFELDHLATRMRRNDENLLVLAGADSSAPRREDALLVDALRAAQSEVELYNRIEFGTADTDVRIAALAVNDVVRLIAELLDNATRFSPPNTVVVADGRRIRDHVVIQVEDRGLGMSEEQMDLLNRRLAEPPGVDVAAFRLMGLAVVGRLASRYGIRVELRANLEGGTIAQVTLPSSVVVLSRPAEPATLPHRPPQPDTGALSGPWGDAAPAGRTGTATATLPAVSGEPWRPRAEPSSDDRLIRAGTGSTTTTTNLPTVSGRPTQPVIAATVPSAGAPPGPANPGGVDAPTRNSPAPTPNRPALPSRASQPAMDEPGPPGAADAGTPQRPTVPGRTEPPTDRQSQRPAQPVEAPAAVPAATSGSALGSPTVPYPMLRPAATTVGFVTPDGSTVPAPGRPTSPHSGWGAALAAMPAPPAPPAPAPIEDRFEAPIFREMEASWFRGPDGLDAQAWSMPTAGYAPPPSPAASSGSPPAAAPAASAGPVAAFPASGGPTAASAAPAAPAAGSRSAPVSGGPPATDRPAPPAVPYVSPATPAGAVPAATAPDVPATAGPASDVRATDVPASVGPAPVTADVPATGGTPADGTGRPGAAGAERHDDTPATADRAVADPLNGGEARQNGTRHNGNGQNGGAPAGRGAGVSTGGQPVIPRPRKPAEDAWRTAADEGWHRAMAAAEPPDAGTTRSGLPKRVPQAQLVPGGVQSPPRDQTRRTPDEVRGLLSAYHRGVQRGRTAGSNEAAATAPAPKENEQ